MNAVAVIERHSPCFQEEASRGSRCHLVLLQAEEEEQGGEEALQHYREDVVEAEAEEAALEHEPEAVVEVVVEGPAWCQTVLLSSFTNFDI